MQNIVRFSSELFNSTIPPSDRPLGEDVGLWVKNKLAEKGHSVGGPDLVDKDWQLSVKKDGSRSTVRISLYDGEDGVLWQLELEIAVPLFTKIFGVPEKEVSPALRADLQQILESEDDVRQIEWVETGGAGEESQASE